MPVRNETVNVSIMVKILNAVFECDDEILIVCDNDQDLGVPVVRELQKTLPNLKLVINKYGRGIPNAIKAGVEASCGKYILLFAVDEIGPVLAIREMIELMDDGCGLVSATRYAYGGRRLGGSILGHLLSRTANTMLSMVSGNLLTDCSTGIKMFTKDVYSRFNLEARPVGWAVTFEFALKVQIAGIKTGEVPVISIDRLYGGRSTFSALPWIKEYLRWFTYAFKNIAVLRRRDKPLVRIPYSTVK